MKDEAIIGFITGLAGAFVELSRELESSGSISKTALIARLQTLSSCEETSTKKYADTVVRGLISAIEKDDPQLVKQLMH